MSTSKNPKEKPKTVRSPRSGAPIIPGNPGNSGGKKGRSGRKPLPFKQLCADILNDEAAQDALRRVASDPSAPGYAAVVKMLASYAEGLPVQSVQHTGEGGGPVNHHLTVEFVAPDGDG